LDAPLFEGDSGSAEARATPGPAEVEAKMGTQENARREMKDEGRASGSAPKPDEPSSHQGHPRGLFTLFGAEAWERFSYYGMRALLVLYLVKKLGLQRSEALEIYGLYTGLVYLTPLLGGYIADKLLGRRKAVLIGGIVMALGQIALMFPPMLHLALGLLIAGNGFFKPNISTMVGGLYREGDTRRDGAFTIFYMGINLGALWSPLICGNLGEKVSFALGFGSAALGMSFGLVQFLFGQKYLGAGGLPPGRAADEGDAHTQKPILLVPKDYVDVAVWTVGTCALVWGVLFGWKFVGPSWSAAPAAVKGAVGLAALGLMLFGLFKGSNGQEAQQIVVIIILCLFNVFFWMGFEQAGGTMTLFADEQTDRNIGGGGMLLVAAFILACAFNFRRSTKDQQSGKALWLALTGMFVLAGVAAVGLAAYDFATGKTTDIPASQFQAINPLLIVALAPTFSNLWDKLDNSKYRTSTPTKMAIGMIILGLGFLVLYTGQKIATASGTKASAAWLVAVYTIHTVGELCLSPIGLSMVTKLAPPRVSSLAMGFWLCSSAAANYLAGTLESLLAKTQLPIYAFLTGSSIGPALLLLALTPLLKKWMHGKA
jgi:POT family proton-dependent oligopeptide transporter